MTSLQVNYWEQQEHVRTNKANERLRQGELNETIRHNQATEAIEWARVGETTRHNIATEEATMYHYENERFYNQSWYEVQQASIALKEAQLEVDKQRVAISAFDVTSSLALNTFKAVADVAIRSKQTSLEEEKVKIAKSENKRQWVNTWMGVADTALGWVNNAAESNRRDAEQRRKNYETWFRITSYDD